MQPIDVLIDFSRLPRAFPLTAAMAALDTPEMLGAIAGRIFCAAPSALPRPVAVTDARWRFGGAGAVEWCQRAMAAAAGADRALLVLLGHVEPGCEAIGLLLEALRDDPMLGFAVPRLRGSRDDSLATLDDGGDRAIAELPRRLLAELPATYLVADAPARCLLIKPEILANFEGLDLRFRSVAGALWHYIGQARRCGFRTIVCNRAVVDAPFSDCRCPPCTIALRDLPEADRVLLGELLPDAERARQEFGTRLAAPAETRLARALPRIYDTRPSLLLDVRNIGRSMNGTAMAALGIAGGLHSVATQWEVALLARREACAVHRLAEMFPDWAVHTAIPKRQFTTALRLSQPWHIQEVIELHGLAPYNAFLFLDTISWDTAYPAPQHLDGTWRFMANHADGLAFISDFTRDRFRRRFAPGASVSTIVSHLSFDARDYVRPDVRASADRTGPLFVVGNGYDHKDVGQTIDLLARAFPYQEIVALGPAPAPTPRVTVLESGAVPEVELHRLYARASAVVFPSFYEGFGFPIVMTLAYGGTLVARRSALLDEIAAQCRPHGRVVPFDRRADLVELVGRVLRRQDVPELRLGTALRQRQPKSWRDVGDSILTFVSDLAGDLSRSRWRGRDHAVRQLMAAGGGSIAG